MARLNVPCYDVKDFTWKKSEGVSDASALRGKLFSRVWDDAIDVGFTVKDKRDELLFTLSHIERDNERDIICWVFKSVPRLCDGAIFAITIYND